MSGAAGDGGAPLPVMTADALGPATRPALWFIGVSTGASSIQRVFPAWTDALGLGDAVLQGVDLPLSADPEDYRRVVRFLAEDPLSRGALVTTHKLDLHRAALDLFAAVDPLAAAMGESSCLAKTPAGLAASAKDAITSGLALDAIVPAGHWAATGADAVLLGAGGAAVAIAWCLATGREPADRPRRIVVTDRSRQRLEHLRAVEAALGVDVPLVLVDADTAGGNGAAVGAAPPGSLVVNATGLGKDAPGSPLPDGTAFPEAGIAWELNYRGDLRFLAQARAQEHERRLVVADGWHYFLHGWTRVIAEVFGVDVPTGGPGFERLSRLARAAG